MLPGLTIPSAFPTSLSSRSEAVLSMALAGLLGYVGWGGGMVGLAFTPLVVLLWGRSGSRLQAFLVMACYYLMAGRALLTGAAIFLPRSGCLGGRRGASPRPLSHRPPSRRERGGG